MFLVKLKSDIVFNIPPSPCASGRVDIDNNNENTIELCRRHNRLVELKKTEERICAVRYEKCSQVIYQLDILPIVGQAKPLYQNPHLIQ